MSENQSSKNESSITDSTLSFFVGISASGAYLFFGMTACSISAVGRVGSWGSDSGTAPVYDFTGTD